MNREFPTKVNHNKKMSKQKAGTEMGYPGGTERHLPKAGAGTRKGCEVQEELP